MMGPALHNEMTDIVIDVTDYTKGRAKNKFFVPKVHWLTLMPEAVDVNMI